MADSNQSPWPFKYSIGDNIQFGETELFVWGQFVGRHPGDKIKGAYLLGDKNRKKENWYSASLIDKSSTKGNGNGENDPPPPCGHPPPC